MKTLFLFLSIFFYSQLIAQTDSVRQIEPGQETSFTNEDLILLAVAGFAVLMAAYFLFRRSRKRKG
jgi:LPXTG-motif cell wall-anchored protein